MNIRFEFVVLAYSFVLLMEGTEYQDSWNMCFLLSFSVVVSLF